MVWSTHLTQKKHFIHWIKHFIILFGELTLFKNLNNSCITSIEFYSMKFLQIEQHIKQNLVGSWKLNHRSELIFAIVLVFQQLHEIESSVFYGFWIVLYIVFKLYMKQTAFRKEIHYTTKYVFSGFSTDNL